MPLPAAKEAETTTLSIIPKNDIQVVIYASPTPEVVEGAKVTIVVEIPSTTYKLS